MKPTAAPLMQTRGMAPNRRSRLGQKWLRFQQRGFALVTTLILMILITVIAVGMLTLSSIALRGSSQGTVQAQARANARIALMLAIGEIQAKLGQDQIATAQATILVAGADGGGPLPAQDTSNPQNEYASVKNPHWLGAFPTYSPADPNRTFYIRRPSDATPREADLHLYDARYCNPDLTPRLPGWSWDRTTDVQWLVSNPNPKSPVKLDPITLVAEPLSNTANDFKPGTNTFRGPLLYPSTTSAVFPTPPENPASGTALACIEARAPVVPITDNAGKLKGGYAWMVSDDSLKYKVTPRHATHQTPGNAPNHANGASYAPAVSPQNVHLEGLFRNGTQDPKLQHLEYDSQSNPGKISTLASLPLSSPNGSLAGKPATEFSPFYQHSFTTHGYGLLTDPVNGGLKRNLTAYLERPSTGSGQRMQIPAITPPAELAGVVTDSMSDTHSLLFSLKDRDPRTNQEGPGSMTTVSDPNKRLTWHAPVFGLLRDYVQIRSRTPDVNVANPVVPPRAPTQARNLFVNVFGGGNVDRKWEGVLYSTSEPSAMTSWDADAAGTYTADAWLPGQGSEKTQAPSMGIHPIVVKAAAYFYPAYNETTKKTTYLVYPQVILYNPYNVKLAGSKYVVSIKRDTRYNASFYRFVHGATNSPNLWFHIHSDGSSLAGSVDGTLAGSNLDLIFLIDNSEEGLMPGEALLFCADPSRGSNTIGGGKFAWLYRGVRDGNVDKMVLSAKIKPEDGTGFYSHPNATDFPNWGSGNPSDSVVQLYSGNGGSSQDNQHPKRMVKLFLPSAAANLSAPFSVASLPNYSLLQAIEAVGRYERNGWTPQSPGTTALRSDQVPRITAGAVQNGDPMQFNLKWLSEGSAGMRLVRSSEVPGNSCWNNSNIYALLNQYDVRAKYVGHTCDVTVTPDQPSRMTENRNVNYYSEDSNTWVTARDGTSSTVSDPLHVLGPDVPLSVAGRAGLNVMAPFMRTGTISASAARSPLFEVPRRNVPLVSLAEFRHAQLQPYVGAPTYVAGTSHGTRLAPRSGSVAPFDHLLKAYQFTSGYAKDGKRTYFTWLNYAVPLAAMGAGPSVPAPILEYYRNVRYQIYDHAYEINHALWDRFFLTGIEGNHATTAAAQTLPSAPGEPASLDTTAKLPQPRLVANPWLGRKPLKSAVVDYYTAAENLVVDGAFNVNCTDPLAWQALLSSFRKLDLPLESGGSLDSSDRSLYNRLLVPLLGGSADEPTGLDGIRPIWQQMRCLTDQQIETLSLRIVEQVKRRAPFISVSDFVNRRLLGGDSRTPQNPSPRNDPFGPSVETEITKWGIKGPLQAAIDNAELNSFTPVDANDTGAAATPGSSNVYNPVTSGSNNKSSKYADAPGYLNQSDILSKLGPLLTVRGDTLTIRAYGDSRDPAGKVLASARCEATIQRMPDYVDQVRDRPQAAYAKLTSDINRRFGRQYKLIAFRWLSDTE